MKINKKYEIKSLNDLCDLVNDDNAKMLATDLALWLIEYNRIISIVRKNKPEECAGLSNTQIAKCHFIWIDDGKHEIKKIKIIKT